MERMSAFRDSAIARRRQDLNPLMTTLTPAHHHLQTPSSSNSLSTPFGYNPAAFTPISAANSYNPQQWDRGSNGSDRSLRYPARGTTLQEVEAPAPPPYSPPRSNQTSRTISPEGQAAPHDLRSSPSGGYRRSPELSSSSVPPLQPCTPARERAQVVLNPYMRRQTNSDVPWIAPDSNREVPRQIAQNDGMIFQSPEIDPTMFNSRPPASRRAVSASAISTPTSSRSRGSSTTRWEPGMPLPPPPPRPPPPSSRSQSMTRSTDRIISPPTRRPPQLQSTLGPVPPTPAGWVDEDAASRGRSPIRPLAIDTSSIVSTSTIGDSNSGSSSSGLIRTGAVRGESRSIRERRSESRTGKSVVKDDISNNPWVEAVTPSDIVVPNTVLGRRPTITKSTPRSSRFSQNYNTPSSGNPISANSNSTKTATPMFTPDLQSGSRGSTPRPLTLSSKRVEAPTPPFSPNTQKSPVRKDSPRIPPKSLPTPPLQPLLPTSAHTSPRPVSHIFHIPNSDPVTSKPLSPSRPPSRPSSRPASSGQSSNTPVSLQELFSRAAIERHKIFAEKEAAAPNDDERVHLFAEFIVSESRMRRERYAAAIDNMGSEILELTRDLFRPYSTSSRRESTNSRSGDGCTPESSAQKSHQGSLMAAVHDATPLKLNTSTISNMESPSPMGSRPESNWWTGYMPSLSPIPSMSVSEQLEETSSRGRPSSRWWEVSQEGSTGAPSTKLERSKRESKYMGMAKEVREALQWDNSNHASSHTGPSPQLQQYGPNEYPPEKVGLHEQTTTATVSSPGFSPAQFSLNPQHLDISRLITLPPSYPRHHPAVNNNHPDLTSTRTIIRQLSNFCEIEATKERFQTSTFEMREANETGKAKRRSALRHNIQREIESGNMSYADAAMVETKSKETEETKAKENAKAEFDLFQTSVVAPLNELLTDRITRATSLFENLRSQLFVDAQKQSPNLTQEEGDEEPELLEKLTVLKWIFECREGLHSELYDLLTSRNDKYRDMVIAPYRLAGNEAKALDAAQFFASDARKRRLQFESEILNRTEEFMDIIETNVVRGVEVQLSAFWDIAPLLKDLVEQIPDDLEGFQIQIPPAEIEENPSYAVFPVQYLYSLLNHAEKSTYQFIESQINLLCLLHEVKSAVTTANCRVMKTQSEDGGNDDGFDMTSIEKEEERRLTDDLKEKVRCVEELWSSALGRWVTGLKERCVRFLEGVGGWDEEGSF